MFTEIALILPLLASNNVFLNTAEEESPLIETHHTLILPEREPIEYVATTGLLPVANHLNTYVADLFFIAYTIPDHPGERPITFIFPGGPGGSSAAEVMCTIGPKRLVTPKEGKRLLPPYEVIDNPETLLPWTDIVFVDPVTTGFSQFTENATEEDAREFLSVDGDIRSLGQFIRNYVAYFERWNSPKYLGGISYGTARSCGLCEYLQSLDLSLHGLILLGSAIDYSLLIGQQNQPLADSVLIPTFAATAWYHGRLWPEKELEDVIEYARRFTYEDYLPVMMEPTRLSPFERREFYNRFALLCGLPPSTVSRYLARFDEDLFTREFMADERKLIGGLDTRYIGDVSGIDNHDFEQDPSYKDMQGILCAFNQYLQTDLQLMNPFDPYTPYSRQSWNFSSYDSFSWPDLLQRVRRTLIRTPEMQIFSGSGYYDCRTPFAATEHAFAHLELPSSYDKNLHFHYYEGGHGFVFDPACLKKLHTDLVKFYNVCEPSK